MFVLLLHDASSIEELEAPVTQTNADGVLVGNELYGKDVTRALDVDFVLHILTVVDTHVHVIDFVKDNLVDLLEIMDLFDVVVVSGWILDGTLFVFHCEAACVSSVQCSNGSEFSVESDLMSDQVVS